MIVTTVQVQVKSEHIQDFIRATTRNHEGSVQEPGNLRFDVLQNADDPTKFLLYEAYESPEAAAAHKKAEHYLIWRDQVANWMAEPRQGTPYQVICPQARERW